MNHTPSHDPYASLRELTVRGMILGALITIVFTASNVYLGLKVGLTFASSIPAAVISMAVLKMFHGANILENNMVQTQASSAGTLSSIIFVLPGLLMLGYWQGFPFWQTTMICTAGGILGVIFTIPLRRVMVVNSPLPYPEGVAAAEILKAGDSGEKVDEQGNVIQQEGESGIKEIALGSAVAGVFSFLAGGLRVVADSAGYWFKAGAAVFQIPAGFSLALLGAGYLVGLAGGIAILVGLVLAWGVAVPYLTAQGVMAPDMDMASFAMGVWKEKVRFIGVGTIGIAAIWTLISLSKPMIEGMRQSLDVLKNPERAAAQIRTDRDLSVKTMLWITLLMVLILTGTFYYFISAAPITAGLAWVLVLCCTLLAVVLGFLVAAACGYMAGLVGSSSSPISGIGIISVVLASLVLLLIGESGGLLGNAAGEQFLTALAIFTSSVVIAIACISNDNLQDLKTGLLVHATPWRQQVALIIGCVVGAMVIAPVLELLYNAYGFTGAMPREGMDAANALAAPQATLMTTIAKGIFSHHLEWRYIFIGIAIGIALIVIDWLLRKKTENRSLPPLAVGMGIYLPPAVNVPIFIGAVLSWWLSTRVKARALARNKEVVAAQKEASRKGTLFAAGLIVGESLIGVLLAMIIVVSISNGGSDAPLSLGLANWQVAGQLLGLLGFVCGMAIFAKRVLSAVKQ